MNVGIDGLANHGSDAVVSILGTSAGLIEDCCWLCAHLSAALCSPKSMEAPHRGCWLSMVGGGEEVIFELRWEISTSLPRIYRVRRDPVPSGVMGAQGYAINWPDLG